MTAFNTIKAGDTLYECRRQKMGNTTQSRTACWDVRVIEVDAAKRFALCSWNGNTPNWWSERRLNTTRRTPVKAK